MSRNVSCTECHALIDFDAHKAFIQWAENDSMMVSSNEACIGCHTTGVFRTYNLSVRKSLDFNADLS
jgi:nitrate/TMAO reductase-like tetraheme cytochrome c subunit